MNASWQMGYSDRVAGKDSAYVGGPVAVIGVGAKDYLAGYAAANRDIVWARNNRPPAVIR